MRTHGLERKKPESVSAKGRSTRDGATSDFSRDLMSVISPVSPKQKGILQLQGILGNRSTMQLLRSGSGRSGASSRSGSPLPGGLRKGMERISGYSLNDVRVRYNSPDPARYNAHAFTEGNSIHISPGQERHLAHEAWHVVQQKQGRVKPTMQFKGVRINDDRALEKEADTIQERLGRESGSGGGNDTTPELKSGSSTPVMQRMIVNVGRKGLDDLDWVTLSTIAFALKESGNGQIISEMKDADFSRVADDERIYLVGHGTGVGSIGVLKEAGISTLAGMMQKDLPPSYRGDIVAMCCRAGQSKDAEKSGVEILGDALGDDRIDIPVYGPLGKSYTHPDLDEPMALDPDMEKQPREEYDRAKKTVAAKWKLVKDEVHTKDIKEQAAYAARFSAAFYTEFIPKLNSAGFLLDRGWLRYGT